MKRRGRQEDWMKGLNLGLIGEVESKTREILQETVDHLKSMLGIPGCLSGWESAFGSGCDPGWGLSPASGSL